MNRARVAARVVVAWVMATGLSWAGAAPRFEPGPCTFSGADAVEAAGPGVECGRLTVPEARVRPDGRALQLSVVRLRATGPAPRPDPVVYLAGGPGQAATEAASEWARHPLRQDRDIVLMDQRGTGASGALCPDLLSASTAVLALDSTGEQDLERQRALALACRRAVVERGVDPAAFNTREAAADLEDLRRALGYGPWNVLGVSYGVRLALAVLRAHGMGVRSAVPDSGLGPATDQYSEWPAKFLRSLGRLSDECDLAPPCREALGGERVEALFFRLRAGLAERPWRVALETDGLFPDARFDVNPQDFVLLVDFLLGSPQTRAVVPALLRELGGGDGQVLGPLLEAMVRVRAGIDLGLHYAVQCPEAVHARVGRRDGPLVMEDFGLVGAAGRVCAEWSPPIPPALDDRRAPLDHAPPALVLSGALDPIAPPADGQALAAHLPGSYFFEVPATGHGTLGQPCTQRLLAAFLASPSARPDDTCLAGVRAPALVGAVHVKGGVVRVLRGLRGGVAWMVAPLLVMTPALLGWPGAALWRRLRHGRWRDSSLARPHAVARVALGLAAALAWTFCFGLAGVVRELAAADLWVVALLGVPAGAAWLFVLPKGVAFLGVVGALAGARAWRDAPWSRWQRGHLAVVLAALAVWVTAAVRGGVF